MPKSKSHKGLLKRIRISKSGKVRHRSAFHKHLSSHKSGKRLRQLREDRYVASAEAKRFEKMLFRRLRGRTQPLASMKRSPSPEQRKAAKAAKAAG
ncbi:MAG: 50S ribosomal protein L35 [Phycisphaerales bacterium]